MAVKPSAMPEQHFLMVSETDHQVFTTSPATPLQLSSQPDASLELIATLWDELASAKERGRISQEEARQEQEHLMVLLAREQCNVQQLLTTRASKPRPAFRDLKLRTGVHKGMAGILLMVTSLFSVFLIFI